MHFKYQLNNNVFVICSLAVFMTLTLKYSTAKGFNYITKAHPLLMSPVKY